MVPNFPCAAKHQEKKLDFSKFRLNRPPIPEYCRQPIFLIEPSPYRRYCLFENHFLRLSIPIPLVLAGQEISALLPAKTRR
jgi:hypothetical protein